MSKFNPHQWVEKIGGDYGAIAQIVGEPLIIDNGVIHVANPAALVACDHPEITADAEIARLRAEFDRLWAATQALVGFIDGPEDSQRPDVFWLFVSRARAALEQKS